MKRIRKTYEKCPTAPPDYNKIKWITYRLNADANLGLCYQLDQINLRIQHQQIDSIDNLFDWSRIELIVSLDSNI